MVGPYLCLFRVAVGSEIVGPDPDTRSIVLCDPPDGLIDGFSSSVISGVISWTQGWGICNVCEQRLLIVGRERRCWT